MTWIMLWIAIGGNVSPAMNSAEFSSRDACDSASLIAKEMISNVNRFVDVRIVCVPKGDVK